MSRALEQLRAIFSAPVQEGGVATGQVLVTPSGAVKDIAFQSIEAMNLAPVLRDIGTCVGKEISNQLESMAMRAADYADLPDMPALVAARLGAELSKAPTEFVAALLEQLRLRG